MNHVRFKPHGRGPAVAGSDLLSTGSAPSTRHTAVLSGAARTRGASCAWPRPQLLAQTSEPSERAAPWPLGAKGPAPDTCRTLTLAVQLLPRRCAPRGARERREGRTEQRRIFALSMLYPQTKTIKQGAPRSSIRVVGRAHIYWAELPINVNSRPHRRTQLAL